MDIKKGKNSQLFGDRTRTQGDAIVNNAINNTLGREGCWSMKKSTTVVCEANYYDALNQCAPGGEAPAFTGEQAGRLQRQFNDKVKNQAKANLLTKHTASTSLWLYRARM